MTPGLLREALAPLLLIGVIAAAALLIGDIQLAAGAAAYAETGTWTAPTAAPALLVRSTP